MSLARLPVSTVASIVVTLLVLSASHARAQAANALDRPASLVGFTITASKMIFKSRREGRFKDFTGELSYDPARPGETHVDLTVFTDSVDMQNAEHDEALKSEGFFDVEHYPTMHFSSSSTVIEPDGTFSMTGDMTIRGITKRLTIPVVLRQPEGDTSSAVLETTFQIDRTDFGINGVPNWKGVKATISKTVQIHIAIATTALSRSPLER